MGASSDEIKLDHELRARLAALAARSNQTVADLAAEVLRSHVDEEEQQLREAGEDEQRWQRYLQSGHTVSFEAVKRKLHRFAARAARQASGE